MLMKNRLLKMIIFNELAPMQPPQYANLQKKYWIFKKICVI